MSNGGSPSFLKRRRKLVWEKVDLQLLKFEEVGLLADFISSSIATKGSSIGIWISTQFDSSLPSWMRNVSSETIRKKFMNIAQRVEDLVDTYFEKRRSAGFTFPTDTRHEVALLLRDLLGYTVDSVDRNKSTEDLFVPGIILSDLDEVFPHPFGAVKRVYPRLRILFCCKGIYNLE